MGGKLLGKPYDRLRVLLKGIGLQSSLIALRKKLRPYLADVGLVGDFGPGPVREDLLGLVHWLIQGDGKATLSFPFALSHLELVLRCEGLADVVHAWMPRPWKPAERRAMERLGRVLNKVKKDPRIARAVVELKEGWRVFSELRAQARPTIGGSRHKKLPHAVPTVPVVLAVDSPSRIVSTLSREPTADYGRGFSP